MSFYNGNIAVASFSEDLSNLADSFSKHYCKVGLEARGLEVLLRLTLCLGGPVYRIVQHWCSRTLGRSRCHLLLVWCREGLVHCTSNRSETSDLSFLGRRDESREGLRTFLKRAERHTTDRKKEAITKAYDENIMDPHLQRISVVT